MPRESFSKTGDLNTSYKDIAKNSGVPNQTITLVSGEASKKIIVYRLNVSSPEPLKFTWLNGVTEMFTIFIGSFESSDLDFSNEPLELGTNADLDLNLDGQTETVHYTAQYEKVDV